jgi:hypothetical protein
MTALAFVAGIAVGVASTLLLVAYRPPPNMPPRDFGDVVEDDDSGVPESIRARRRKGAA